MALTRRFFLSPTMTLFPRLPVERFSLSFGCISPRALFDVLVGMAVCLGRILVLPPFSVRIVFCAFVRASSRWPVRTEKSLDFYVEFCRQVFPRFFRLVSVGVPLPFQILDHSPGHRISSFFSKREIFDNCFHPRV